jgi:hypothetical protein
VGVHCTLKLPGGVLFFKALLVYGAVNKFIVYILNPAVCYMAAWVTWLS